MPVSCNVALTAYILCGRGALGDALRVRTAGAGERISLVSLQVVHAMRSKVTDSDEKDGYAHTIFDANSVSAWFWRANVGHVASYAYRVRMPVGLARSSGLCRLGMCGPGPCTRFQNRCTRHRTMVRTRDNVSPSRSEFVTVRIRVSLAWGPRILRSISRP